MKVLKAFLAVMLVSVALLAGSVSAKKPVPGGPIGGGIGDIIVAPQGFFDPDFQYLFTGYESIKDNGNQTITIGAVTTTTQTVQLLGATIYFDKWNGNSWDQLNSVNLTDANKQVFTGSATFTATKGYYYRARILHWAYHNGVYESSLRVTPSMLCS